VRPLPAARARVQGRPVRRAPVDSPWLASDLIRSGSLTFIGLIGLAVCWYGVSGRASYENQIPWVVGAVASVVVSGCGVVAWLLAGIREVHREMNDVLITIRAENLHQNIEEPIDDFVAAYAVAAPATQEAPATVYVTNGSMTRAHRPGCQHVQGREVEEIDVEDIAKRGLKYCGVCCP
jgi:hypothetical protein